MLVQDDAIKKAYIESMKARNGLLHYNKEKQQFHPKICCLCDRHIHYKQEEQLPVEVLYHPSVKPFFHQDLIDWCEITESEHIKNQLKKTYTQTCIIDRGNNINKYLLSPRSYAIVTKYRDKKVLGACKECKNAVYKMKRKDNTAPVPPPFAIATGLLHGYAPKCLQSLNESELIFISTGRINKHLVSYTAGSHKTIQGWHSMNYSDIEQTNRVVNYLNDMDSDSNTDSDSDFDSDSDSDTKDEEPESVTMADGVNVENDPVEKKKKSITIIMVGPFTTTQKALTRARASIRPSYIKKALKWLRENNVLYADYNLSDDDIVQPKIIDSTEPAQSINSNVERIFEVTAVFPDPNLPTRYNGGCETASDLKQTTLNNLFNGNSTLISRTTDTILRDYEGNNLLRAFPLMFPYGTGGVDIDGNERKGVKYYQYLRELSSQNFHKAEFVTILHNMFERSKMINGAHFRLTDQQRYQIGNVTGEQLDEAMANFLSSRRGTGPADMFITKMKAITKCMGHTEEAAKQARQNLFSMITRLGLPSCMFTITPQDDLNFRIKIMSMNKEDYKDYKDPPETTDSDEILSEFVVNCSSIASTYPGLCAIDFENIISITIHHFLGWDETHHLNIADEGLFGDLDGWAYCVEEQSKYIYYIDIKHELRVAS